MKNIKLKLSLLVSLLAIPFVSQAQGNIFDDPQNLKVLPKDINPLQLRATMRGFALGTGYRCTGCHVGEEGKPLDTFDFPSDEKQTKKTARLMIEMVREINQRLENELGKETAELVKVECVTCHRGQHRPIMLDDLLVTSVSEDGVEQGLAKYRELRGTYYGTHTYDFGEMTLINVAERLVASNQTDGALKFLDLNIEFDPGAWMSHVAKGRIHARGGDKLAARKCLESALEIDPNNAFIKNMIRELGD
ncbi:MAG: c-type cytochrome [Pseudomonadota bacterium]